MDELIAKCCTGTVKEFANEMGVCERTLHDYLDVLKDLLKEWEVTIIYNTTSKSYQYSKAGRLEFTSKWINKE